MFYILIFPVVVYGCESWTIKKVEYWRIDAFELWCWRILLRVPRTARRSNRVHPKGNQSWIFIGRTDAKAETPILWPPDAKNWLIGKDREAGKDWRQEEKGMTEDEIGWHHLLNEHKFEQAPGIGDEQGSLACCSPWGRRVRHNWVTKMTDWLTDILIIVVVTWLYKFIQNVQLKQVHLLYVNFTSIKLVWKKKNSSKWFQHWGRNLWINLTSSCMQISSLQ